MSFDSARNNYQAESPPRGRRKLRGGKGSSDVGIRAGAEHSSQQAPARDRAGVTNMGGIHDTAARLCSSQPCALRRRSSYRCFSPRCSSHLCSSAVRITMHLWSSRPLSVLRSRFHSTLFPCSNHNAETRDQTGDLQIFSLTLSQLSYRGAPYHSSRQ